MLRTLNTFALDLMCIRSVEDLLWYVAQNVVGRLGFVDCVIYLANDDATELKQAAAWGEKTPSGARSSTRWSFPLDAASRDRWRRTDSRLSSTTCATKKTTSPTLNLRGRKSACR